MSGSERRPPFFELAATVVSAGVLSGWVFALVDLGRRLGGRHLRLLSHLEGSFVLFALSGAAVGLVAAAVAGLVGLVTRPLERRRPRLVVAARALCFALVGGLVSASTAFWLFSGGRARLSALAHTGPWLVIGACAGAAAVLALAASTTARWFHAGRRALPIAVWVFSVAVALGLMRADLTLLVSLYSRLHTLVEALAAFTLLSVASVVLHEVVAARPRGRKWLQVAAAGCLGCLAIFLFFERPRSWLDRKLAPVWLEPVYAGRMLARTQELGAFLANPRGWQGAAQSGLDRLRDRYDIESTALDPAWSEGSDEPTEQKSKIATLRVRKKPLNIVVFYVDTLRADVAHDSRVMPNLGEFMQESVHFTHAYTAGSDTVHALPALTSGRYDVSEHSEPSDLLEVARRTKTKTALVIPQSAHEFLGKERPSFRFDDTIEVGDYGHERKDVWGYGADQSSAGRVVDRTLGWLEEHQKEHFLLWAFNFDVHNWREIADAYVSETARAHGLEEGPGMPRYRAVAAGVDVAFGRLLSGIDKLGLRNDTLVLFVSDHGEGVGRDGFWVHSIFLWEALVHVPLAMRIPGVEPRVVWSQVSLVDVAPTLARYLDPKLDMRAYHGEDLLGYLFARRPPRRLPILMIGAAQDGIRRIGIVEQDTPWKLVLQLESGAPELYDTSVADPDWDNVAEDNPRPTLELLSKLVRSPLFPRKETPAEAKARDELAAAPGK